MKKIMALTLAAIMILGSAAVFADDAAATNETAPAEETVLPVNDEAPEGEVVPTDGDEIAPVDGEEAAPTEDDSSIIMLQINNKIMFKNDEQIELDVPAQTINDRTMVPMRAIFEALNAEVTWDEETQTATGEKDGIIVKITIDSNTIYIGENAVEIDVPAQVVNDRTLVPVRAISEAFGALVSWDEATETVIIKAAADNKDDAEEPSDENAELADDENAEKSDKENSEAPAEKGAEELDEETPDKDAE